MCHDLNMAVPVCRVNNTKKPVTYKGHQQRYISSWCVTTSIWPYLCAGQTIPRNRSHTKVTSKGTFLLGVSPPQYGRTCLQGEQYKETGHKQRSQVKIHFFLVCRRLNMAVPVCRVNNTKKQVTSKGHRQRYISSWCVAASIWPYLSAG